MLRFLTLLLVTVISSCAIKKESRNDCQKIWVMYESGWIDVNKQGVGLMLNKIKGDTIILQVIKDGPADKTGSIQVGDKIIALSPNGDNDYIYTKSMKLEDIVMAIRGCENTPIVLKLFRDNREFDVAVLRGRVNIKNIKEKN